MQLNNKDNYFTTLLKDTLIKISRHTVVKLHITFVCEYRECYNVNCHRVKTVFSFVLPIALNTYRNSLISKYLDTKKGFLALAWKPIKHRDVEVLEHAQRKFTKHLCILCDMS